MNILQTITDILHHFFAFLPSDFSYEVVTTISSALLSHLLVSWWGNPTEKKRDAHERSMSRGHAKKAKSFLLRLRNHLCLLVSTALVYVLMMGVGVVFFALYQTCRHGSDFGNVFCRFGLTMLQEQWMSVVWVPLLLQLLSMCFKDKGNRWILRIIAFCCVVLLIFAPYIFEPKATQQDYGVDNMIYTKKFYDISNFRELTDHGYLAVIPSKEPTATRSDTREAPTKKISNMNFAEAIDAMLYYDWLPDLDLARQCNDRAYALFKKGRTGGDKHDIGLMWWYKGNYENQAEWYYNAGIAFEEAGNHYNAAVSFAPAYKRGFCDAERALKHYYESACEGNRTNEAIDFLLEVYNREKTVPHMQDFVTQFPDDPRVQILNITDHAEKITADDAALIDRFLKDFRYQACPKLLILKNVYYLQNGMDYMINTDHFQTLPDRFFDPEDIINVAWLLYMKGEYDKADQYLYEKLSLKNAEELYPEYNLVSSALYLHGVGDQYKARWNYAFMNNHFEEFKALYDNESVMRYDLVRVYLGNKLGYKSESDDINQAFSEKDYEEVIRLCDEMISAGQKDPQTLIQKANALIALAYSSAGDERKERFAQAESTLLTVHDQVNEDYKDSVERLRELYKDMPNREVEFRETDQILRVIQ